MAPEFNDIFIESRLQTRITDLRARLDSLEHMSQDNWCTTAHIADELEEIKAENIELKKVIKKQAIDINLLLNAQEDLIKAVEKLSEKKEKIATQLSVFSSFMIKRVKHIETKQSELDETIQVITKELNKLSLN